jgi:hypothetical protein
MAESSSPTKFWHPLRLWQVLLVFLGAQLVGVAIVLTLREGLGLAVPGWIGGGIGGALGVIGVQALAARKRRAG